jgi:hypothetical protein
MSSSNQSTAVQIAACLSLALLTASVAFGQSILFVRGADRSGGFLEAGTDFQRTEQLADIFNASTVDGNHGWAELRMALEAAGYDVEQIAEQAENTSGPSDGIAVAFDAMNLEAYDVIVMGSNNAVYSAAQVDALEAWIRSGGGALFISDANFGGDWADAPDSDQQFLDRFGLVMNQDRGTYVVRRDDGDYARPGHPILAGVDAFDGEGVSPIVAGNDDDVVAGAEGSTRVNTPPFGNNKRGQTRPVNELDGALVVIEPGEGRIAGHFDRNTFFNRNGAGTDIHRFDNLTYAINLFGWLAAAGADDLVFTDGFEPSAVYAP